MIPAHLQLDHGSETGTIAIMHAFLRSQHGDMEDPTDAVIYGPSTSSQVSIKEGLYTLIFMSFCIRSLWPYDHLSYFKREKSSISPQYHSWFTKQAGPRETKELRFFPTDLYMAQNFISKTATILYSIRKGISKIYQLKNYGSLKSLKSIKIQSFVLIHSLMSENDKKVYLLSFLTFT